VGFLAARTAWSPEYHAVLVHGCNNYSHGRKNNAGFAINERYNVYPNSDLYQWSEQLPSNGRSVVMRMVIDLIRAGVHA